MRAIVCINIKWPVQLQVLQMCVRVTCLCLSLALLVLQTLTVDRNATVAVQLLPLR